MNTELKNSQSCRRNGTTNRMSRYLTFSAASHAPTPAAVPTASSTNGIAVHTRCSAGKSP